MTLIRSMAWHYPSFHRRIERGQQAYAAGRARWRNRAHMLGHKRRQREMQLEILPFLDRWSTEWTPPKRITGESMQKDTSTASPRVEA